MGLDRQILFEKELRPLARCFRKSVVKVLQRFYDGRKKKHGCVMIIAGATFGAKSGVVHNTILEAAYIMDNTPAQP